MIQTVLVYLSRTELKLLCRSLILCLFAATAAAFLLLQTAKAKEEPENNYVDLVMLYEHGPSSDAANVVYSVRNNGTETATGVTVSFELEDLEAHDNDLGSSITGKETVGTTGQRFTWEIGTLPPGEYTVNALAFSTRIHSGIPQIPAGEYRIGVIRATASSIEIEDPILLANNSIEVYSFADPLSSSSTLHLANNRLGLLLSVNNLRPDSGGDVDFGLTAQDFHPMAADAGYQNAIADIVVEVELSEGLDFKTGWNPSDVTVASDGRSATWEPAPVDRKVDTSATAFPQSRVITINTQLTSVSLDSIPLEKRCITARVASSKPSPSTDYAFGSLRQCLGDDPPLMFEEGTLQVFTGTYIQV